MIQNQSSPPAPVEPLWTVHQVAEYLQLSVSWTYKAVERGELPCRRIGASLRFVPSEVRRWAEATSATVLPLKR